MKLKRILTYFLILLSLLLLIFSGGIWIVYDRQDQLVQNAVEELNHDLKGRLEIRDSHIAPFTHFPYISIDLEDVRIFEGKSESSELLMQASDAYLGFDFFQLMRGDFQVRLLRFDNGFLKLVQHEDGSFNIANALSSETSDPADTSAVHIDLRQIRLENIDLLKYNESSKVLAEAFIEEADSRFRSTADSIEIYLDSRFLFNLIVDQDTTFLHDKHVGLETELVYDLSHNNLIIKDSEVLIEKALFTMGGTVNVDDDMDLDLSFKGNKPNFDLLLAFAPEELSPVFERYDNGGQIYFDAQVVGRSINGHSPKIDIEFGCAEAFVQNTAADKAVNDLFFKGYFTNGEKRSTETMSLSIRDFSARPETGTFEGSLEVHNFDSPDIDMQITCDFDLDFLAKFLNLNDLENVSGNVSLQMNFHDIVDLSNPEKSIEKLNESYFTSLHVQGLSFSSASYPLPVSDVNIEATMDGHRATISKFDFKVGQSDVSITATVSDLPAILHHTSIPVESDLTIHSSLLNLQELTGVNADSASINEIIHDLSLGFRFKSSARAFTESPNLPLGEFFIRDLHARFMKYPHELHDFHADVLIDSTDFNVIDFTGMIDQSDFHFNGKLENYDLWFAEKPQGITRVDFDIDSKNLELDDLFSYGGENYVPEDYRHEVFSDLRLHGIAELTFDGPLKQSNILIDHLTTSMKVHPMRFNDFRGQFLLNDERLEIKELSGILGNSDFNASLTWYFEPEDPQAQRPAHVIRLNSNRLDFDQITAWNPPPAGEQMTPADHEAGFNIFELPFADLEFSFEAGELNYHRIRAKEFKLTGRMQKDHYLFVDTLSLEAAGGKAGMNGYFNGSDPKAIYFSPHVRFDQVDIDQLMFKFENFGQEHLLSENLHGKLSGDLTGKIHVHPDLMPIIDDSELHINFMVQHGSLDNYSVFHAMSDYFRDKNLDHVRFDTLRNSLDLKNGMLSMPAMNINSSLGYFEVSGNQDQNLKMEYFVRIPIKVVTKAGMQKLFGPKNNDTSGQVDEIQYRDESRRTRFVNLKIEGTPDDYKISLGKDKSNTEG